MNVKVRLFALTHEIVDKTEFNQTLPQGSTLGDFSKVLFIAYPALENLKIRFAINMSYVNMDTVLQEADEIACIPPVGGG